VTARSPRALTASATISSAMRLVTAYLLCNARCSGGCESYASVIHACTLRMRSQPTAPTGWGAYSPST
jgi:hypothetical protein